MDCAMAFRSALSLFSVDLDSMSDLFCVKKLLALVFHPKENLNKLQFNPFIEF